MRRVCHTFSVSILLLATWASVGRAEIIPAERRVSWNPGLADGIPYRTNIFCNVKIGIPGSTNIAYGDGVTDDTAALRDAIKLCPRGQVVYIPEGTYIVSSSLYFTHIREVTIRGDGPEKTILKSYAGTLFNLGSSEWNVPSQRIMTMTSGYSKGATRITVESLGDGLFVGKLLLIDQLNDPSFVSPWGSTGSKDSSDRDHNGTRLLSQIVKVTAIDGNEISFSPPLHWTYSSELDPEATVLKYNAYRVGVEDMKLVGGSESAQTAVWLSSAHESWIQNVETERFSGTVFVMRLCLRTVLRGCYVHHVFNDNYQVGSGYGMNIYHSSDLLIEDNLFDYMRVPIFLNHGSSGCVVGYNYSINQRDSNPEILVVTFSASHGSHPKMNLWEGNVAAELQADYYRGSSSHMTLLRNHFRGNDTTTTRNRKAISFDRFSLFNNVVGNVLGVPEVSNWVYEPTENDFGYSVNVIYRLGYPHMGNNSYSTDTSAVNGYDPRVASTLLRHGNFDYSSNTTIWDTGVSDRTIPESYYLSGKPSWWGNLRWPAIGPDLSPMVGRIPAQARYEALQSGLAPPLNPRGTASEGVPLRLQPQ